MIGLDQRKQKELWRRRTQKIEALKRMAKGLKQEFASCLRILDEEALNPLILESFNESHVSQYLRGIESLREKGNKIVQDLTILSKTERDESGAVLLDLKKIVQNAVASTRGWLREAIARCGSEINVKTYLRNIAPVRGNPNEIEDVFRNMISNAIDALPEGGEIYLTTEENFGFAYVYIQDNGVGIPDDIKEQIFDPFFTTKSGSRQGVGLTTAHAIIDKHWGEIEVMSNVGQGSTFIIKLPIAKKPPSPKAKVARNRIKHSHILIISSGGIFKDLLCQLFVSKGGKVTSASNGGEALKLLKKNKFDLVIADLNVPYLESSRIISRLKKTGRGLPVALAIGDETWRSPQTLRKLGVDLVISRPLEMDRTLGLISQALSMRK
jgi:CheY-like chemotaxis protein